MTDVRWAALVGATIIRRDAWEKIPARHRPAMLEAARAAGEKLRGEVRSMNEEAIAAMQSRKLNVVRIRAEELEMWRQEAVAIYPKLRGTIVPADLFDRVQSLRDEFREQEAAAGSKEGEEEDGHPSKEASDP
jgi:TRAP-type C4-dicarboxylate transport system substrate-binding protein